MGTTLRHISAKLTASLGAPLVIAAGLALGCTDGATEIAAEPPPASVAAAPPARDRSEALYGELREKARQESGQTVIGVDERLKAAEAEFPLEFRFSYERATLVVFGRRDHHETFERLHRAAEKAIATGQSEAMLAMLRSDGARGGPFWKLARGHSEWRQTLTALEHGDREALWKPHHAVAARARAVPRRHAETETHDEPRIALTAEEVARLRRVRARMDRQEASAGGGTVAANAHD